MPRAVFERVGPFDESFVEACEDWDWSTRARRRAVPIVFDPSAAVDHPCMSRLRDLKLKAERLGRGELLLNEKSGRAAKLPPLLLQVARQIRHVCRLKHIRARDRLRVACVGLPVAYWTWRAARRERARLAATATRGVE